MKNGIGHVFRALYFPFSCRTISRVLRTTNQNWTESLFCGLKIKLRIFFVETKVKFSWVVPLLLIFSGCLQLERSFTPWSFRGRISFVRLDQDAAIAPVNTVLGVWERDRPVMLRCIWRLEFGSVTTKIIHSLWSLVFWQRVPILVDTESFIYFSMKIY